MLDDQRVLKTLKSRKFFDIMQYRRSIFIYHNVVTGKIPNHLIFSITTWRTIRINYIQRSKNYILIMCKQRGVISVLIKIKQPFSGSKSPEKGCFSVTGYRVAGYQF